MTVGDLKKFLADYPEDMPILTKKFVQRWSGDPHDTDLSGYENCSIRVIEETTNFSAWDADDPRHNDRRRTVRGDKTKCLVIRTQY